MASQLIREWPGIQQFPAATQTKLLELLGKLKQENVNTLTILVIGKGGVGKSSTVNSIVGERAVTVNAFQSERPRPVMVSRTGAGFMLNIIDSPGLVEGGYVNDQALELVKRFLLNKTIDVLLYVDQLDAYRVDNLDRQVVRAITDSFRKGVWHRGIVALTHGQLSPPDGLSYEDFCSRRSKAILKVVRLGARIRKKDLKEWLLRPHQRIYVFIILLTWEFQIPVVLVENSGRCNKNDNDEKILPNGSAWIPDLVKTIADAVLNGSKSILVDKKLDKGVNPNERGKIWIPFILPFQVIEIFIWFLLYTKHWLDYGEIVFEELFEYFFVIKGIQGWIKDDIAKQTRAAWNYLDPSPNDDGVLQSSDFPYDHLICTI